MTRVFEVQSTTAKALDSSVGNRVWGHTPLELHDAYWRSLGVQCVRRGETLEIQGGSDLYMLMEPGQCAIFDLTELANSVVWNRAPLSRVRVTNTQRKYVEKVLVNRNDELIKIRREYGGLNSGSCRILLTRRASLAQVWAESSTRRLAWTELRRFIDWTRTDHYRIEGFLSGVESQEQSDLILKELVAAWENPATCIEGIRELEAGVWGINKEQLSSITHVVPPVWIGFTGAEQASGVVVGPRVEKDSPTTQTQTKLKMLDIDEIWSGNRNEAGQRTSQDVTTYQLMKRLIDIVVSFSVLVCISPILAVVAIAVILDDGVPVFFGHTRQTLGARDFKCWKFRTMLKNAESMVKDLQSDNIADGPQVFIKDDPRITRIGKLLRRFHLDELPQFWNVLVGDMSLVGPRPSPDKENQFCPAWREARLSVRPGITGLWQVERTRAPGLDFQEWIKYDIEYVNRASLLLDVKIVLKTIYRTVLG